MFELDYEKKAQEIQDWIAKTVGTAGFQNVVVAVSGGVDSAVSLNVAIRALGEKHVYALLLPHGELSKHSLDDGRLVAEAAGLTNDHIIIRDVEPVVKEILKQVQDDGSLDIRRGNMMARARMIFVFDLAKQMNALVIGTENKTEHYLGYFTRFGDEASDMEPIRSLYKTQVWEMAKHLKVPQKIIEKAPSAGLWESQTDEKEFGFSYLEADKILYNYFEKKMSEEKIIAEGFDKKIVDRVLLFVKKNDFKHHVPYVFE